MELEITYFDVAERAKDITTRCLRFVINKALTEKYGASWVKTYIDKYNSPNSETIDKMHGSIKDIQDFDFQACLKMFAFMYNDYGSVVLSKYHLTSNKDTIIRIAKELMPFRNKTAHRSDSKQKKLTEDEFERGYLNMLTLLSFFPDIYDNKTKITYKSQIEQIYIEYKNNKNMKQYFFSDFKEFNGISDEKIVVACTQLSIKHDYAVVGQKKKLMFYSSDKDNDIKKIRLAIDDKNINPTGYQNGYSQVFIPPKEYVNNISNNKKKKSKWLYILPAIICVIVLILIISGIAIALNFSKDAYEKHSQGTSAVNDILNDVAGQIEKNQDGSNDNANNSTTANTNQDSSTNQIPDEFKTKFEASDADWTEDLSVGETNLDSHISGVSTIWSNVRGYSEDTSVATVDDDLIVTAKAKGVVKVLFVGEFMGHDEMYIVEYTVR